MRKAVAVGLITLVGAMGMMGAEGIGTPTAPTSVRTAGNSTTRPPFTLRRTHDSLYHLNGFRLPYPVYRFDVGDVDGDGQPDALVGVVKTTRFHPEKGRRLFIFHLVEGKVRPLWMGSRLGGILQDFRYADNGTVRSLETTTDGKYVVADYRWEGFGLSFQRFLVKNVDQTTALRHFNP